MFKIVEFSHLLIKEYIIRSKLEFIRCLDATCGNGFDTLYMANLLKEKGHIDSYDIQQVALDITKEKLESNNITNVSLINNSHEFINPKNYDLAVFNLGYLPNADKSITTHYKSSLKAIKLLTEEIINNSDLLIIICIYPGHEEGKLESLYIDEYVKTLDSKKYLVCKYLNYNRPLSPYIISICKN